MPTDEQDYLKQIAAVRPDSWTSVPRPNSTSDAMNAPSQEAYEARGALDRIHNLIDGIESRIFSTQAVPAGKDAIEAPPEPIAVMLCGIRQRAESAEQRLRSLLERL